MGSARFARIACVIALVIAALITTGCGRRPTLEKSEVRTFELVAIDPPKHFYVDLKDVETGVITHHYVSKRCGHWRQNAIIGETYEIVVETYGADKSGTPFVRFKNLRDLFCLSDHMRSGGH